MVAVRFPTAWNPTELGPLDRCLRCFDPAGSSHIICPTCGATSGVLDVPVGMSGEVCIHHGGVQATRYCVYCGDPVCPDCIEREGISIISGRHLPYCKHCLQRARDIEHAFLERLQRTNACSKHPSIPATFRCTRCDLPLCDLCSYFLRGGIFRVKLRAGPFCLVCFRWMTDGSSRDRWLGGAEARRQGLCNI